jgi:hypothetical protein
VNAGASKTALAKVKTPNAWVAQQGHADAAAWLAQSFGENMKSCVESEWSVGEEFEHMSKMSF